MGMDVDATIGFGFKIFDTEYGYIDELFNLDILDELELSCSDNIYISEIAYDMEWNGISYYRFGTSDYTEIYFFVDDSVITTEWTAHSINPKDLIVKPEWLKLIKEFEKRNGLDFIEPEWVFGPYVSF